MSKFLTTAARRPYVLALASVQRAFTSGRVSLEYRDGVRGPVPSSADAIGGNQRRTLRRLAWVAAQGRCSHCRQATRLDVAADAPDAATLALLIPASVVGSSSDRLGYQAGNISSFCRACVSLSNDVNRHADVWVWVAASFDAECALMVWPSLPKSKPEPKGTSTVDPIAWMAEVIRVAAARGNLL